MGPMRLYGDICSCDNVQAKFLPTLSEFVCSCSVKKMSGDGFRRWQERTLVLYTKRLVYLNGAEEIRMCSHERTWMGLSSACLHVRIFILTGSLVFKDMPMVVTGHPENSRFEVICIDGTRNYFFEASTYAFVLVVFSTQFRSQLIVYMYEPLFFASVPSNALRGWKKLGSALRTLKIYLEFKKY